MDLIDRLLGRPTLTNLIRDVRRFMQAQGLAVVKVHPEQQEVVVERNGSPIRVYLGNLRHEYIKAKRRDRQSVLGGFLASIVNEDSAHPASYADARTMLLPVIRSIGALGVAMTAAIRNPDGKPMPAIVQRPLVADLAVSLVIDRPRSMSYVNIDHLADWNVSLEQAIDDALHNLRVLPEHGGWTQIHPGLWQGTWGDTYESSRILLPDLIHRLGVTDPVAMVPFRDVLLVTSQANVQAVQKIVDLAVGSIDNNTRWVSFELLRLNGVRWESYAPAEHQAQLQDLSKRNLADAYDSQKQILDAHFEAKEIDIYVGAHQLVQRDGDHLSSYAVWTEGIDILLPQADRIALVRPEHKEFSPLMISWSMAQEHFGEFFETTDYSPTRYMLKTFPEPQAIEAVRQLVEAN
ncbi:hypothetical protein OOZ63_25790 [Paucibacter sp. PLA-PC-4]|uniref:hypothetical protein n=1 Tax=Paucibacter sp. PLA-PC-4 TaxID=2993655 RepID=UPI00224A5DC5|nr:hypothetical protein [Paucibacter sp. PLA-PC-4]MCX2865244.1 hypothetical protein [Paucibacter sp. PLA-PC-4]